MNIFYLDQHPEITARYHCDQHVNKMILEGAQLLSTVARQLGSEHRELYKQTHPQHPCTKWLHESLDNCEWLLALTDWLNIERTHRWMRPDHASIYVAVTAFNEIDTYMDNEQTGQRFTEPPQVMPIECQLPDTVSAYQQYYRVKALDWTMHSKAMTWTNRDTPDFMQPQLT